MKLAGRQDLDLGLRRKKEKYVFLTSLFLASYNFQLHLHRWEQRQRTDGNEWTATQLRVYGADKTEARSQKSTTIIETW